MIISVIVRGAIIQLSDSRIILQQNSNGITYMDGAEKLFQLGEKIGIAYYGTNPWAFSDALYDFQKGTDLTLPLSNIADNLLDYLMKHEARGTTDFAFHLCGYYQDLPYLYRRSNLSPLNTEKILGYLCCTCDSPALDIVRSIVRSLEIKEFRGFSPPEATEFLTDLLIYVANHVPSCGGRIQVQTIIPDWHKTPNSQNIHQMYCEIPSKA